jgi:hypothetical protein
LLLVVCFYRFWVSFCSVLWQLYVCIGTLHGLQVLFLRLCISLFFYLLLYDLESPGGAIWKGDKERHGLQIISSYVLAVLHSGKRAPSKAVHKSTVKSPLLFALFHNYRWTPIGCIWSLTTVCTLKGRCVTILLSALPPGTV